MTRLSRQEIQTKIQTALVGEVVKNGIGAVTVGDVAKSAGVSPGTIYIHFENKDDLLQKIYLKLKCELHETITAASNAPNSADMVKQMWFNLFAFISINPFGFLFLEYAGTAQVLNEEQTAKTAHMHQEIETMLARAINDGTLADLPVSMITTLLVAPAMYLARYRLTKGEIVTKNELEATFERVWLSIANPIPTKK